MYLVLKKDKDRSSSRGCGNEDIFANLLCSYGWARRTICRRRWMRWKTSPRLSAALRGSTSAVGFPQVFRLDFRVIYTWVNEHIRAIRLFTKMNEKCSERGDTPGLEKRANAEIN